MKKYIIRQVGWVYDDDWYNFDMDHDIEGVYDSKKKAIKRKRYLNHQYFLKYFEFLRRYQLNFSYDQPNQPKFIDTIAIAKFLAKKLSLNKDELLVKGTQNLQLNKETLQALSEEMVEGILGIGQFSFFKIVELPASELYLFQFKRNPTWWASFYNEALDGNPDYFYYFFDDRDMDDNKRLANSIKECYEVVLTDRNNSIAWHLSKHEMVNGAIEELSNLPELLLKQIENSKHLYYDENKQVLKFDKKITPNELMALDALLKEPIILTEKISLANFKPTRDNRLKDFIEKQFGLK